MKYATPHPSNRRQSNNYYDFRMNLPARLCVEKMREGNSDIGDVRFGTNIKTDANQESPRVRYPSAETQNGR